MFIFVLSICLCIVRVIDRITILNGDLVAVILFPSCVYVVILFPCCVYVKWMMGSVMQAVVCCVYGDDVVCCVYGDDVVLCVYGKTCCVLCVW